MENKFKEVDDRFDKEFQLLTFSKGDIPSDGTIDFPYRAEIKNFLHSEILKAEKQAYLKFTKFILDDIAERSEFDLDWEEVEKCLNYSILEIKKEVIDEKK